MRKHAADCDALLLSATGAKASRLWGRFQDHREALVGFLYDPAVPPTNNASERVLRQSVVQREGTGASARTGARRPMLP